MRGSFGDGTIYFFSGAFGPASVSYSIPTWSDCDDNYAFGKVGSPFTVSDVEAMLAYVADNDSPPPFYYGHIDSPLGSYELVSFPPDLEGQLCYLAVLQPQQLILLHFSFIYLFRNF